MTMGSSTAPLLSFIVLSYNYEKLIGKTLQSIFDQTITDFEVIVVDDASSDRSCEVIRSFGDPRVRLLINEQNIGGTRSYNRAVESARGEFLINLDADDWIAPNKSEIQLQAMRADPKLDMLSTYVRVVDIEGNPHPARAELEAILNRAHDFNLTDTWVAQNLFCRSSSMVRRSAHLRIGLDDPAMVRAPDYELWTRALRDGCRFGIIEQPLTYYRLHAKGVTHGDPMGTFLELSYGMVRNLLPIVEERGTYASFPRIVHWVAEHPQFVHLRPVERYRLLGMLMASPPLGNFTEFLTTLRADEGDPTLAVSGRRVLATIRLNPAQTLVAKLQRDGVEYRKSRDYWRGRSDILLERAKSLEQKIGMLNFANTGRGALKVLNAALLNRARRQRDKARWFTGRLLRASLRFFRSS